LARIENHRYSIVEAFTENFYIVPDYQREYVWTDKEVQQLLEDINEQFEADSAREYFIGTILVSPTADKNHFDVIDGQQRLTTFFLLLCALKHVFKSDEQRKAIGDLIARNYIANDGLIKHSLKLEPRYENASEIMAKIVELDAEPQTVRAGIQAANITSFGSLENLVNAYDTLHRYLQDNYDVEAKLRKYLGHLASNVVFIQISTDVSSALKIFETINERGVGLNPMDLLKNLLFTQVKQDKFTQLKDEWKKITKPLEKQNEKPLRFLRYFLMANYVIKNGRNDAVVREDEIYDWLVDKGNAALCDYANKPFEFVRKIIRNVEHYLAFAKKQGNDGNSNLAMDSLNRLTGGAFSLHYVLLLAAANFPKPLFDHLVTQMESFLFCYIFTKTPTKDLERNFSLWADELRAIGDVADATEQKAKLNAFIRERFEKSIGEKSEELSDALKRMSLNSMQQYRTRYFLAKITQYVDMAFKGLKAPDSLEPYTKLEIEHILPNNPKPDLRTLWAEQNPSADYENYKNRLGNLTLFEKPLNIVAGNDFYDIKKSEYEKSGNYLTRSLPKLTEVGQNTSISRINEYLEAFPKWNAASIEKRHECLISLSQKIWRTAPMDV
jgi:hypothetical protein